VDLTGTTLAHYRILAPIGKGGMGEVYAAEDLKLSRQVALKVLPEKLAGDPDRRMRFEREAKAIAALNHPNIVTIYSVEEAGGIHFFTMEMVTGKPLSELIPRDGLPLERLLSLAVPLVDAVGAAHRKGIVHRDLKPANVVVGDDGRPKVLDFGLAKLRPESDAPGSATQLPTKTETQEGRILGTVAYMSPEQAEGRTVDARSDIFSLGVLLYHAASGRRPFRGDTAISTISSILRDTPDSILDLNRSLPRHLGRIVGRCLAKDPERRYQSAIDLRNDLEGLEQEIRSGEVLAEAPARPGRRGRLGWLVAAAAVVGASILGYAISNLTERGAVEVRSTFEGMKMTRLTTTGDSAEAILSPDGRYVAFVKGGTDGDSLWLRQVSLASSVQIVPPTGATLYDPTFSPDGDAIYFVKRERDGAGASTPILYRVPTLGGSPMKVLEDVWERISFSPDGSRFAFIRRSSSAATLVMTATRDGGDLRTIGERAPPGEYPEEPAWSPDGAIVAVPAVRWIGRMEHSLVALPAAGGAERPISERTWSEISEIAWLPDGSGLVVEARESMADGDQLWEVAYPEGRARRITNDLNSYDGVGITADGSMLVTVVNESSANLWIAPGGDAAGEARRLSEPTAWGSNLMSWTPDGRIVHASAASGDTDVWVAGEEGGSSQLTLDASEDYDPVVCEGRYVVFGSNRAGSHNLWRMDLDGGNKRRLTSGAGEFLPRCDGRGRVIFQQQGPSLFLISAVPIEGGEAVPLSEELNLAWWTMDLSPDGQRLAYVILDEAARRWVVEILDLASQRVTRPADLVVEFESHLSWSPDGNAIHLVVTDGGVDNLWSRPLDGGSPRRLTGFAAGRIRAFAWSPDGTRIALAKGTISRDIILLERFR
jgi:Tol biopolymer transport system component